MRLLHVSDLHFNKQWFAWTKRVAKDFDAIAITGDVIDSTSATPITRQIEWLIDWIRVFPNSRLLICSGNHDHEREDLPSHLQHWMADLDFPHLATDGDITSLGATVVQCVGWGKQPQPCGPRSIALMHCPPAGGQTAIEEESGLDYGDYELALTLLFGFHAPELILSGHVHRRRRWNDVMGPNSLSLNPGFADGPRPPHIVIDLSVRTAEFVRPNSPTESVSF